MKKNNNILFFNSNMYIKNMKGRGLRDGLFYYSQNSLNVNFKAKNVTLENLNQFGVDSTIFFIEKNNTVIMEE